MSYNGSGTFLINTAGQPVVSGTVISSTAFNALTADLATGLSTAITKDGQTTVTANIPMGTYKFTGLGAGTAATDSANLSQVQSTVTKLLASVSGADTITAVASPTLGAYAAGQMFYFVAAGTNTGAVTLNIDSLGAKAVTRDGSTALTAGDLRSGEVIVVVYDGTRFQVVSQVNSGGDATFANVSITSALNVGGVATFTGNPVLSGGTANGVLYLNGSKVATSGSALTFDGTTVLTTPRINVTNTGTGATFSSSGGSGLKVYGASGTNQWDIYLNGANVRFSDNTGGGAVKIDTNAIIDGNLGIGTSSPALKLDVAFSSAGDGIRSYNTLSTGFADVRIGNNTNNNLAYLRVAGSANGGIAQDCLVIGTGGGFPIKIAPQNAVTATFDVAGNLGLGVTPSAWNSAYTAFQSRNASFFGTTSVTEASVGANVVIAAGGGQYISNGQASIYQQVNGTHIWYNAPSGTAGAAATFTQAMTLDLSGNLVIGKTSTNLPGKLDVQADTNSGGVSYVRFQNGASTNAAGTAISIMLGDTADNRAEIRGVTSDASNGFLSFWTQGSGTRAERARITSGGSFLVGKTTTSAVADIGFEASSGGVGFFTTNQNVCIYTNRKGNDGELIQFYQDTALEGNITVSGNTVSYNAFAGSHWSQLQDGSKPDILRGTVMESINELCEWPDENNERLPKSKISDTAGSKKVYGVFMAWDNDWTETNDMYVTAVGAFICRVNGSVTVQEGDLLESNGDGTARVQADDIIRSSTIGKVTSTVKTHEYDDGSYCVPTVLYCG